MEAEFLSEIRVTHVLDCLADTTKVRVLAELAQDVREVLPYLAALLPQAGFSHTAGILNLMGEGRLITVYPRLVTLARARDQADAWAVLEWLRQRINEAHARRDELVPCYERHRSPRLLDVYRLLPGGNCRRCGYPTCMALAARLAFGEAHTADCPRLAEAEFARHRRLLAEWLGEQTTA